MRKLHMGTMQFDLESMEELKSQLGQSFSDSAHDDIFSFRKHQGISGRIKDVVCALALCHNVTPVLDDDGQISLQAASPDEIAIVSWVSSLGLQLIHRDIYNIVLEFNSVKFEYQILEVFPFTSESKRMGIILKENSSGDTFFLQKGKWSF